MIRLSKSTVLGTLLLFGAAGCVDLEIDNPNAPDATQALAAPGDVESLISGAYSQWWRSNNSGSQGISLALSGMSFQHSSSVGNFGVNYYSGIPRSPIQNDQGSQWYPFFEDPWIRNYRAISAVTQGLRALDTPEVSSALGPERTRRARAFARFVQGLSHAQIAVLYDQGFIVDKDTDLDDPQSPVGYNELMTAALEFLDEAIAVAGEGTFTIPSNWASRSMSNVELAQVASSMKARYRASVARNPTERGQVNWNAVISEAQNGVQSDWIQDLDFAFANWAGFDMYHIYVGITGTVWSYMNYFIEGMADQSGRYQQWLSLPLGDRRPDAAAITGSQFLIITPDLRFPQGSTLEQQRANPGKIYRLPGHATTNWQSPARGTWRWSYYDDVPERPRSRFWNLDDPLLPEIPIREMRLLMAEGYLRTDRAAQAAAIINETRTQNGLNATNASGLNSSCVPKLPNGQCGNLLEMLKWEKRLETGGIAGPYQVAWYFDGRGWGDLYKGTPLHWPIPTQDLQTLQMPSYTFGGTTDTSQNTSQGSQYGYPHE